MENKPSKDEVISVITDILVNVVGWIEKDEIISSANLTLDLHIDSDDLSIFSAEVIKHFCIKPTKAEWYETGTVEEITELVLKHLPKYRDAVC